MELSIIIVNWNGKQYLEKCLVSIFKHVNNIIFEVIVVDNASTDGSQEYISQHFPGVILICNNENYGFAKANNIGIKASSGDYISLVNSDILFFQNCYPSLINFMDTDSAIGIVGPKILNSEFKTQRSCMSFPSIPNLFFKSLAIDTIFPQSKFFGKLEMTYFNHDEIRTVDVLNGCFWLTKREHINVVGLLSEEFFIYGEDLDWCQRFNNAGYDVVFFPSTEIVHFGGGSSSNAPIRFYIEMQKANYKYWKKYHDSFEIILYLLIQYIHHSSRAIVHVFLSSFPMFRKASFHKFKRHYAALLFLIELSRGENDEPLCSNNCR